MYNSLPKEFIQGGSVLSRQVGHHLGARAGFHQKKSNRSFSFVDIKDESGPIEPILPTVRPPSIERERHRCRP